MTSNRRLWLVLCAVGCGGGSSTLGSFADKASAATHLQVQSVFLAGVQGSLSVDGADCGSKCQRTFAHGGAVTLVGDAGLDNFAVDCPGAACVHEPGPSIVLDMSKDHAVAATFRPRINFVFVTATGHGANFGGLAGADALCADSAAAAGLGGRQYVAWLSTSTVDAAARLRDARGWIRIDGAPVIDSVTDLAQNELFHPIRLDEYGRDVTRASPYGFIPVWTGTSLNYGASPRTCSDWTSADDTQGAFTGSASGGAIIWNLGALYACQDWSLSIYCFEIDYTTPVDPPAPAASARLAFLSHFFSLRAGGSIADADAECATEAAAAGLSGSFKALLADVGTSAASRFDANRGTWVRLDGVPIVERAADLFVANGPRLDAPIDLEADGQTRSGIMDDVWTGFGGAVDDYTVRGSADSTCNGWSSTSPAQFASSSIADFTWKSFRAVPNWPTPTCASAARLYCLQE
jgi:hypothetical protein